MATNEEIYIEHPTDTRGQFILNWLLDRFNDNIENFYKIEDDIFTFETIKMRIDIIEGHQFYNIVFKVHSGADEDYIAYQYSEPTPTEYDRGEPTRGSVRYLFVLLSHYFRAKEYSTDKLQELLNA